MGRSLLRLATPFLFIIQMAPGNKVNSNEIGPLIAKEKAHNAQKPNSQRFCGFLSKCNNISQLKIVMAVSNISMRTICPTMSVSKEEPNSTLAQKPH